MASIRVRKETGKLFLDFKFQGKRCREQTLLDDIPSNRKKLKTLLQKIEAEITLGIFNYGDNFPNSKLAGFFAHKSSVIAQHQSLPSFKEFAGVWFNEKKAEWRHSYHTTITGILNNRLYDYFGDMNVDHIKKSDLLHFRAQLAGIVRVNGEGYSSNHINRHMKILRMIINEAADRYDFTSSFRGIKPLKIPKTNVDPFTFEEIGEFLANVRPDFKDYYTVRFLTGMRTSEIDGLKWRFVNFDTRQILIREALVKGRTEETKTSSGYREIEMSDPVYDALKHQYEATSNYDYVFVSTIGTPLSNKNVSTRIWHPTLRLLGFRRRNAYQTRHTAATLWLASGENPEWIARQMGHSNTEMLFRVYSRFVPNLTRQDGSAFQNLLNKNLSINTGEQS